MTLSIELSPEEEARLAATARQKGIAVAECARQLLAECLFPGQEETSDDPTLALFAQWDREDARLSPEELEQERQQFEAFQRSVNTERARAGSRRLF